LWAENCLATQSEAISGAAYAALSASTAVLGLAAHATHFVVLAALAGFLVLLYALESDRGLLFFLSGTSLGFAFLMKQPGIVFSLFAFAYWAYRKWDRRGEWKYVISRGGAFFYRYILAVCRHVPLIVLGRGCCWK